MAAASNQATPCPILIGRTEPQAALEQLLEVTREGNGQLALIAGEAGIGKTRLVREIAAAAQLQGWLTLDGYCFPQDRLYPYAPFLDLLRTHFRQLSHELAAYRAELAPLLPELLPLPDVPPIALEPEQEKRRRFATLIQFLIQQAAQQPVLLIIEDIHWSDDVSLELLFALARQLGNHPILLVLTYRGGEDESHLLPWLAQLERARLGQEIDLARLTRDEVAEMLVAMLDLKRPPRLETLEALFTLTEGNPFFIEEVLKAFDAAGETLLHDGSLARLPLAEIRVPRSIQDAVRRGATQVSEAARRVLAFAAVVGRGFDFTLLLSVCELSEAELLEVLKELIAAQLIVEESGERFAFRHALVREAVYADLLVRERATLHRTVALTVECLARQPADQRLTELAHHFSEAGEWEPALAYARRAGEQALRLDAPRTAAEQLTRALAAAQHLGMPTDPALLRLRGQAYETIGEFERAHNDLAEAVRLAHETQDLHAECQAQIALGLLWTSRDYKRAGQYLQLALRLARVQNDPAMLAHSLNRLGNWYMNAEAPREAEHYHHEALTLFQTLDDRHGLAETFDLLGMATATAGDIPRSFVYFQEAASAFRALNDRQGLITPLVMQCVARDGYLLHDGCMRGIPLDIEAVIQQGEEALRLAQESGWRAGEAFARLELAMCFGARGEYPYALALGQQALAISEEIEHQQWIVGSRVVLGRLHLDLLALPQAQHQLERALELARTLRSSNWMQIAGAMLAATYLQRSDLDGASALLATVFDWSVPPQSLSQRMGWCVRGELALARGDPAQALQSIDYLRPDGSSTTAVVPRLWQLYGEAQAGLGEWDAAAATLREALTAAQAFGLQPMVWRIHLSLARVYQLQRRHEAARAELVTARAIVEALAARLQDGTLRETFVQQARALLPSPRPRSSRQQVKQRFSGLTTREREVAVLLARGKSNREVAAHLVVSERTVEYHVGNILGKLGLFSRSQVAIWAVEHGLTEQAPYSMEQVSGQ